MTSKKSKKADLEHKRAVLLPIGLAVAAAITLTAFEWIQVETNTLREQSNKGNELAFEPIFEEEQKEEKEKIIDVKPEPKPKDRTHDQKDDETPDVQANVITNFETQESDEPDDTQGAELIDPGTEFGGISIGIGDKPEVDLIVDDIDLSKSAKFVGGEKAMYAFLGKHITYPQSAKRLGKTGKIFVEFVIDKEGNVGSTKILGKPFDEACAREALSAVNKMPQWIPGEQFGRKVKVRFRIPVFFTLQ